MDFQINHISGIHIPPECQTVLDLVQVVCKSYQPVTKVVTSARERAKYYTSINANMSLSKRDYPLSLCTTCRNNLNAQSR